MVWTLFFSQVLNGIQLGMLLFLLAAGLTLVFGIMNFVNLSHGSFYMMGAYFAAATLARTDSFLLAGLAGVVGAMALAWVIERVALRRLYSHDHLNQVLATLGLIMFFNELVRMIWGSQPLFTAPPTWASGNFSFGDIGYPSYRLLIIGAGAAVAVGSYLLIHRTRVGMLVRASSTHADMVAALGVNARLLNTALFSVGAGLAALAGWLVGPIVSVQSGMGDTVLILALVVIVIGGIGSIRGAFVAALLVGLVETGGRAFLPALFKAFLPAALAADLGPAIASISMYVLMAVILVVKPTGLFPARA